MIERELILIKGLEKKRKAHYLSLKENKDKSHEIVGEQIYSKQSSLLKDNSLWIKIFIIFVAHKSRYLGFKDINSEFLGVNAWTPVTGHLKEDGK